MSEAAAPQPMLALRNVDVVFDGVIQVLRSLRACEDLG